MSKINLLEETKECLATHGKTTADVVAVSSHETYYGEKRDAEFCGTWDEFAALADFEYDCGYGGAEVNEYLLVIGKDWWLERGEYEGSEWWEFKTMPIPPVGGKPLSKQAIKSSR
jgi:hypothetical protein